MNNLWIASYVALWFMMAFLTVVVLALLRQVGLLHMRIQPSGARTVNGGPEIGSTLDERTAVDIHGATTPVVQRGRSRLLLFVAPSCPSCEQLLPALKTIAKREKVIDDVVLITGLDDPVANEQLIRRHKLQNYPYVVSQKITDSYQIYGAPYAIVADRQAVVVAKGIVNHTEHLESLIDALRLGKPTLQDYLRDTKGVTSNA